MIKIYAKNWSKFQHYKDRNPPWIKLYRNIIDDRKFMCLPIASKALAPCLWLLASEFQDGIIKYSIEDLAWRLRMSEKEITNGLKPLIDNGFFIEIIDDDSDMLANSYQQAIPETETETETELDESKKQILKNYGTRLPDDWKPDDSCIAYCKTKRPDLDVAETIEAFCDYWHSVAGAKGRKADWGKTWKTWVRNQRKQFNSKPSIDPTVGNYV